jgi:hypothetical protein
MQTITVSAEVQAKNGKAGGEGSAQAQIGESIEELSDQFGEEVVYSHARRSIVVAMQTFIRNQVETGKPQSEIAASLKDWKPTLKKSAKSPVDKAREEFAKMSPEDRKRFLKEAREMAAAAA